MKYYIFESEAHDNLTAITADYEGAKLDPNAGPWRIKKEVDADNTRGLIGFPTDLEKLNADLESVGVQYHRLGVYFTAVPGN